MEITQIDKDRWQTNYITKTSGINKDRGGCNQDRQSDKENIDGT